MMTPEARAKIEKRMDSMNLTQEERDWIQRAGKAFAHFVETGEFKMDESEQETCPACHNPVGSPKIFSQKFDKFSGTVTIKYCKHPCHKPKVIRVLKLEDLKKLKPRKRKGGV
jgi:hypothetical protein